jgi:hypothetical protein
MKNLVVENGVVMGCDLDAKSVILPENVNTIGRTAFYETALEEITLNEGLETIEPLAFLGTNIKTLNIPKSVKSIGVGFISGCNKIESITVDENNENYYCSNNCLVDRKTNKVLAVVGDAIIPDGITKIEQLAFYGRNHHITVEIPDSVTKIAKTEFEFLPELEFPITIKAKKGSYAIQFAKENEIEYIDV